MLKSMNSETRLAGFCCKIIQSGVHLSVWGCEAVEMDEQKRPKMGFVEAGQWDHADMEYAVFCVCC